MWVVGPASAAVLRVRCLSSSRAQRPGALERRWRAVGDAAGEGQHGESEHDHASGEVGDAFRTIAARADADAVKRPDDERAEGDREQQPRCDVRGHEPARRGASEQRVDGGEARRTDRAGQREQDHLEGHTSAGSVVMSGWASSWEASGICVS
jgi:hypothetical protein